jgi:hypothetical protein
MASSFSNAFRFACFAGLAFAGSTSILRAESTSGSEPSIRTPGPDLANFPNSAFTLPQGRSYVELVPFNFSRRTPDGSPTQFSSGYLLRYGLTNDFELRLQSDGYTVQRGPGGASGMSPQILDFKWHVMDEKKESFLPAMGVEFALQTNWGSRAFRGGTQPGLSLNFDQTLPLDIAFEYNVGVFSQNSDEGKRQVQVALSWAFQREVVEDVAVFVNGYTNTGQGVGTSAIGGGMQWTPTSRLALFTNLSGGLTQATPKFSALLGFAVAF